MLVYARHAGGALPFERDRLLTLRRLPVGAAIRRAAFTLGPISTDSGGRFLEALTFPAGGGPGDRGATKVVSETAVELDLHARRRLASLVGTGLTDAPLLVDLGGGFLPVTEDGGLGPGDPFELKNTTELPGLTVTGLRVPGTSTDVSVLNVSSPPSNVTLAVEGGPVFFAHLGDLVQPATTPNVAAMLQALLPDLLVEHGCHVVPFLLHSDTIARLDITLELEFDIVVNAAPDGLRTVQAAYRYGGVPEGAGLLSVRLPTGLAAVEGATTGRVQGAFAPTRVVHGPVTAAVPPELVTVEAGRSLAQPFVLPAAEVVSAVDLLLTSVTAEAQITVDIVNDLDGKPGRTSLLDRPAEVTMTRDNAGAPTWLSVPLRTDVEIPAGRRYWIVTQARTGSAAWSAGGPAAAEPGGTSGPALQHTRDGGLSWRAVASTGAGGPAGNGSGGGAASSSGLAAALRLRHTVDGFHLPLELHVVSGGDESAVSLQRFAATGQVDFGLEFPEVARAINETASAELGVPGGGERVANGDFADWYRLGSTVRSAGTFAADGASKATLVLTTFSSDGVQLLGLGSVETGDDSGGREPRVQLVAFDVLTKERVLEQDIADGVPHAVACEPSGRRLVVATSGGPEFSTSTGDATVDLLVVDAGTGQAVGVPVQPPEPTVALAASSDGRGLFLAGLDRDGGTVVRHVEWSDLTDAANGTSLDWDAGPRADVTGRPLAIASAPGGQVLVLVAQDSGGELGSGVTERLVGYRSRAALAAGVSNDVVAVPNARGLVCPPGRYALVLGNDQVEYVRVDDLVSGGTVDLGQAGGEAHAFALDPTGELAIIARQDGVAVLDVTRRRVTAVPEVDVPVGESSLHVSISPAGTHAALARALTADGVLLTIGDALPAEWELTAGQVRPDGLPATGEVLAVLGRDLDPDQKPAGPEPAGLSQVVPVTGGARYRFAFDGVALSEEAVAEVRWIGDGCTPQRTDRLPVYVFDVDSEGALETIPRHERFLVAPVGATQAEVRFFTPEGLLWVDRVTLSGSTDLVTSAWEPSTTTTTVTPAPPDIASGADVSPSLTLTNGGTAPSTVSQVVAVTAGDRFELEFTAIASGEPGAVLEVELRDDAGVPVGLPVGITLDALAFDAYAPSGDVPNGAVEADVRFVLPPGAVVELEALSLRVVDSTEVTLYVASEAPGELTFTDVTVSLDETPPTAPPVPPDGMCPPTPTGDGADDTTCYCQACGSHRPMYQGRAARTDAGRAVIVTPCPTCGTPRIRTGGHPLLRAERVPLPRFRALDRPQPGTPGLEESGARRTRPRRPALVSQVRIDVPVTDLKFVGEVRAAQLRAAGLRDLVAIARADVATVASLPGVSDRLAAQIIADAAAIVRARGRRVLLNV